MKRLLIIDDDAAFTDICKDALSGLNIDVRVVQNGKLGLEHVMKYHPDLIMLDVMLSGGINGFDVAEQLQKDPKTATIPFVFLTNLESERESAMKLGASDYLIKSNTNLQTLIPKLKKILGVP